ncbi:MAG: DNA starvation/stationary phase protection protein [Chlamydiia bacterium]|nr:DNA starvation/stationary phase protection protein [Chlamydiia bacterium]
MATKVGLKEQDEQQIITHLYTLVCNTYALYFNMLNCHWNIEAPAFSALHEMLEDQYQTLAGNGDQLAERIRMMGQKVPTSIQQFAEKGNSAAIDSHASWQEMLQHLIAGHKHAI